MDLKTVKRCHEPLPNGVKVLHFTANGRQALTAWTIGGAVRAIRGLGLRLHAALHDAPLLQLSQLIRHFVMKWRGDQVSGQFTQTRETFI